MVSSRFVHIKQKKNHGGENMENLIWYIIMIPGSALLTGIGIYAWNRKKPMWFWSGTHIKENEISDVTAYNHANGIMWIVYSLIFWMATFAGENGNIALILIVAGCVIGLPVLVVVYKKIYAKYKVG